MYNVIIDCAVCECKDHTPSYMQSYGVSSFAMATDPMPFIPNNHTSNWKHNFAFVVFNYCSVSSTSAWLENH